MTPIRAKRLALLCALAAFALGPAGCASLSRTPYVTEPGVSATIHTREDERFSATVIGVDEGMLVFDRSYPKSESLSVVERGGEPVVLVGRIPVGTAVEVREFDVVVRERHPLSRVEDVEVATGAYFGWGALVGAVLTFGLVMLTVEE